MEKTRKNIFKLIPFIVVFAMLFTTTFSFAAIAPPEAVKNVAVLAGSTVNEVIYDVKDPVPGSTYSAQVTNGTLPAGLSIVYENGKFLLKGKAPTTGTQANVTVEYIQGADVMYDQKLNVSVVTNHKCYFNFLDAQGNPSTDINMHNGKVGEKYSFQIKVDTCGDGWTAYSVGDMPPGLTINEAGCIVGVPEQAGTFKFYVSGNTTADTPVNNHNTGGRAELTVTITDENADDGYTIEIPITKSVEMDGNVAPPAADISFSVNHYDYSGDESFEIVDNTMKTGSGEGTSYGTITVHVNNVQELGNLAEGLIIRENRMNDTKWITDSTEWVVYPNISEDVTAAPTVAGVECFPVKSDGSIDVSRPGTDSIIITNTYIKDDGSDPNYPYTDPKGDYTLKYVSNGGTEYADEKYADGKTVNLVKEPAREGYTFTGWYIDKALKTQVHSVVMDSNKTVYAGWVEGEDVKITQYELKYVTNGGNSIASEKYTKNATAALTKVPVREGYTFTGWFSDSALTNKVTSVLMNSDKTVYAGWTAGEGTDPGTDPGSKYTLTYETNGGSAIAPEKYAPGETAQLTNAPVKEAYTFTGWYKDEALTTKITSIKMDSDKTVYAGYTKTAIPPTLNGDNHFAYVIGYEDGTVRPQNNITRAEVATIFFRLLKPEIRDGNLKTDNSFKDSKVGDWYNTAVSTLAGIGVINGRTADTFAPGAKITRAEFATICARFDTATPIEVTQRFTDTKGHWAESYIEKAATLGWIKGYADGTFKPDQYITRAEAMTLINRVTQRIPETKADLLPGMRTWSDNASDSVWFYIAVQEATNSHDFNKKGEINERWTKLTTDPDWTKYN